MIDLPDTEVLADTYDSVRRTVLAAHSSVSRAVNSAMVFAYWDIGRQVVEASGGKERAEYGEGLLKYLSKRLTAEFGKGFDVSNLRHMRQFYVMFPKQDALRLELSWTHYRLLMRVENEKARAFYLDECVKANWSTRQLERQITTFFYERLLVSKDKDGIKEEIGRTEPKPEYEKILKDPYVLEFLCLPAEPGFYEKDLESALISNLQKFLLELGRGFSFVARQKRISFDTENFYIDLVFYNYILKCFVLIDLKTGKLTHQDLGQMQMYVNYYTRDMMNEGDDPPIGIVLCADKSETLVRYTLPEGESQIFASKYMLCLPKEEELAQLMAEWVVREEEMRYERR
ncbi:MAG: PDDEXK nuclease domain-containing protein [Methanocorpusculum sp.]|uniref:PDDEXK nuclease domain-containing protein n=1 Tax=Methanocorpusculum sp. TaxID=2058474 RepID=UPI00271B5D42|nr:PDDEXK nuclease domain-containing protein [Methanocorpusculum sp.]MDO9523475.1 PDDEXK nuclease domain-containing protein [Methanocorpusculum sp.]